MVFNSWYATRESVKRAGQINGADRNTLIDNKIVQASREIDGIVGRFFVPVTEMKMYEWPQKPIAKLGTLFLDEDLLSVTTLTTDDDTATVIASTDYFLEPQSMGPPYHKIEIDKSSSAMLSFKNTTQRAIRVTGQWGYCNDTVTAGTVVSGLASPAAATTFVCSNAALIGVGDSLLIESEQLRVTERELVDSTANLTVSLTASASGVSVTVNDGSLINTGETIVIESEAMYVTAKAGNVLTVIRAYDSTVLAAHTQPLDVYVYRTLTVERGVNGTTAATHANTTAVRKYVPPADVSELCKALALNYFHQDNSAWLGQIGSGEGAVEARMIAINALRDRVRKRYRKYVIGST